MDEDTEERSFLLKEEDAGHHEFDQITIQDEEQELDWSPQVQSHSLKQQRSGTGSSWCRTLTVTVLVLFTVASIISYFKSGKQNVASSKEATVRPQEDYILSPDWDFSAAPTRREYHWTIEDKELNPDGVYRPMMLINNMFPGPLIECNQDDEIWVHVYNRATNATAIHWHGLYQNGTNWMDGTVGVTQCPIAPGTDFTYKFRVSNQSGTYWYHSHVGVQMSDGLVGPLVIHSKKEKELQKLPYATDRIVMVQDHYYDLSGALLMDYLKPDQENAEPIPDGALINGRNIRNCDEVPNRRCDNSTAGHAQFSLEKGQNHRLRIINVGAFAEFQIQFDEHEFAVSEVDGTDVLPEYYHRLNINAAQRYSVILTTTVQDGTAFWMRARMITHCFAEEKPEMAEEVRGILQYGTTPTDKAAVPSSRDWPEIIEVICKDMNTSDLHPVVTLPAPATVDAQLYLRSNFEIGDWRLSRGFFNSSSWRAPISSPSLGRAISSLQADAYSNKPSHGILATSFDSSRELIYQTTGSSLVLDILIQNFDDGNHPMHLHGHKFWVLAQGHGYPPPDLQTKVNLTNPLTRDTASVEAFGWVLLRFVADNPGMWAFHCHIAWHAEAGLFMQFLVRGDVVSGWDVPEEVNALCKMEGIERGKGPDDSIWVGDGV